MLFLQVISIVSHYRGMVEGGQTAGKGYFKVEKKRLTVCREDGL